MPPGKILFNFCPQYGAMHLRGLFIALLASLLGTGRFGPAWAAPLLTLPAPGASCRAAISAAEQAGAIPPLLLAAIGRVESGRRDPASGVVAPWPWTINAEGQGSFYDTKSQAIAAAQALQARGVQSIDVGCMQVNLMHHPGAFANLDQAFDPSANTAYAARFLNELHGQTNDWMRAAAQYHSSTPALGATYQTAVEAAWTQERSLASTMAPGTAGAGPATTPGVMSPMANAGFHGLVPTMPHVFRPVGRDLAAYRAAPVMFATRAPAMVQRD
jgi:Transglycosylase SLT domain